MTQECWPALSDHCPGPQGGSGVTEDTGSGPASRTAARQTVTARRADAASRARRRAAPEGMPIGGGEAGRGLTPLRLMAL